MPEKTGTITGLITNPKKNNEVFGLNIDGDEFVYSFPQYRGEPFDDDLVEVGYEVRIEYQDTTDKAGKNKSYISVLEVAVDTQAPEADIFPDAIPVPATDPPGQAWGYREKDILMFIESCAKGACGVYAAALQGGQLEELPKSGEITALARSIEEHGVARFKALLEALD